VKFTCLVVLSYFESDFFIIMRIPKLKGRLKRLILGKIWTGRSVYLYNVEMFVYS